MKKIFLLPIILILCSFFVLGAVCEYNQATDGHDYFNVTNNTYNYTQHDAKDYKDILFISLTDFTPRLNFTVTFNDTPVNYSNLTDSHLQNGYYQLNYYNASNVQVFLANGTNVTQYFTYTSTSSYLACNNASLNNSLLYVTYTRLFIKNVDDLISGYSSICTQCGGMVTLDNSTFSYGQNVGFKVRDSKLNGNNYAVEWLTTNRTCTSNNCDATLNSLLFLLSIIMILSVIGGVIYYIKTQKDSGNLITVITVVIISIVLLGVLLYIINLVRC